MQFRRRLIVCALASGVGAAAATSAGGPAAADPKPTPKGYTVLFTRHAESQTNTGGAIGPGQSDLPLTELGQQQAQQLAVTLHDAPINSVNASSMIRAIQTANPTAADHGLQVTTSSQIRELDPNGTVRCDSWFGGTPIA